jgi:membrane protease YdiL (CAAX protease family)
MITMAEKASRWTPLRECLAVWAASLLAIVSASLFFHPYAKLVATVAFLYLPLIPMRRRGEGYRDYGVTLRCWRKDLKLFLVLFAAVVPLYLAAYVGFSELLNHLPPWLASRLSPYGGHWTFKFRLPANFELWVLDQLLVVALPEEFFYRGYLQTRLRLAFPAGPTFAGVRLGPAFFLTALLFAFGHLAVFQPWRLAVFFPALLFGWLRERTGTILGCTLFHAACNLYELMLRASFFGG